MKLKFTEQFNKLLNYNYGNRLEINFNSLGVLLEIERDSKPSIMLHFFVLLELNVDSYC